MSAVPPISAVPALTLIDGRSLPQLGVGVWQIPDTDAASIVRDALLSGYRLIDTATIYGNETGVGVGLRQAGIPRGQVSVTTKLWNDSHGYDATLRAFEASVARLELDYVDLYLIHWPVASADRYVDSWRAMVRLQAEGRIRSIGVSNFKPEHIQRLVAETGVTPVVNQIELHPCFQQREIERAAAQQGIITEAWSPLGQGKALTHPVITELARKYGRTPAQIVLRWHLDAGRMVIPKSARSARLAENLAVFDFRLDRSDRQRIDALDDVAGRMGEDPDHVS